MIQVSVIATFDDDKHSPHWIDGESFDFQGFLPAVPPIDTVITGIMDYERRGYSVRVERVGMTVGDALVCVYGMVV